MAMANLFSSPLGWRGVHPFSNKEIWRWAMNIWPDRLEKGGCYGNGNPLLVLIRWGEAERRLHTSTLSQHGEGGVGLGLVSLQEAGMYGHGHPLLFLSNVDESSLALHPFLKEKRILP